MVSNWTATLNIIQDLCHGKRHSYLRLDGSTATKERQSLVDTFNRQNQDQSFIFLLSAKAGGVGLNLIGYVRAMMGREAQADEPRASRLILFDSDWCVSSSTRLVRWGC